MISIQRVHYGDMIYRKSMHQKFLTLSIQVSDLGLCLFLSFEFMISSSSKISFCLAVRFTGVSTKTWHIKSPIELPLTEFRPLPLSLKVFQSEFLWYF